MSIDEPAASQQGCLPFGSPHLLNSQRRGAEALLEAPLSAVRSLATCRPWDAPLLQEIPQRLGGGDGLGPQRVRMHDPAHTGDSVL